MNRRALFRSHGLVVRAAGMAIFLLAALLLAGSAHSAGGHQNADHSDGRMTIRPSDKSGFSHPACRQAGGSGLDHRSTDCAVGIV